MSVNGTEKYCEIRVVPSINDAFFFSLHAFLFSTPRSPGCHASSVGYFSQQHALQLPDPAPLRQHHVLLRLLLVLQQLLDVEGRAQQDVAGGLHGEDGPSQSLPGDKRAEGRRDRDGQVRGTTQTKFTFRNPTVTQPEKAIKIQRSKIIKNAAVVVGVGRGGGWGGRVNILSDFVDCSDTTLHTDRSAEL